MKFKYFSLLSLMIVLLAGVSTAEGRRVKTTIKIEKNRSKSKEKITSEELPGMRVALTNDTVMGDSLSVSRLKKEITFQGYEKEASSRVETMLVSNHTKYILRGFTIRISYLDLKERLLHSREVTQGCVIPPGETRKIDIKSWDPQNSYYYYLGNEPRRVATPYKVSIEAETLWLEN